MTVTVSCSVLTFTNLQTHLGKVLAEGSYVLGFEACQQVVVQAVQLSLDILRQLNVNL